MQPTWTVCSKFLSLLISAHCVNCKIVVRQSKKRLLLFIRWYLWLNYMHYALCTVHRLEKPICDSAHNSVISKWSTKRNVKNENINKCVRYDEDAMHKQMEREKKKNKQIFISFIRSTRRSRNGQAQKCTHRNEQLKIDAKCDEAHTYTRAMAVMRPKHFHCIVQCSTFTSCALPTHFLPTS